MILSMTRTPTAFLSFAACLVLAVVSLNAAPAPRTANAEDVRAYLQKKYPANPDDPTARFRFEAAKIVEADAPALRKWLPRTRFFVTKISTTFLEYREVETLVSVSISGGKVICQECFSSRFTTVSPESRTSRTVIFESLVLISNFYMINSTGALSISTSMRTDISNP